MKINGKKATTEEILSLATGIPEEKIAVVIWLKTKLAEAEKERDYWRQVAIQKQQQLEAIKNAA